MGTKDRAQDIEAQLMRLAAGAIGGAVVVLLISATLPGGFSNWSAWADRVAVHRYMDGSRQVGLRWLFSPDGSWLGGKQEIGYPARAQLQVDRQRWLWLCATLLLVPVLVSVRRLPPLAFAAIAGVTASFAFGSISASSWSLAIPLLGLGAAAIAKHDRDSALLWGRPTTVLVAGCLALCVGMHGIVRVQPSEPWMFNMVYSHMLTTVLLGLGAGLLLFPGLRERGDPPGAPASIPVLAEGSGRQKKAEAPARAEQASAAEEAPRAEEASAAEEAPEAEEALESEEEPETEDEPEGQDEPETEDEPEDEPAKDGGAS